MDRSFNSHQHHPQTAPHEWRNSARSSTYYSISKNPVLTTRFSRIPGQRAGAPQERKLYGHPDSTSTHFSKHYGRTQSIFRAWWLEIAACFTSITMVFAIIGILYPYNNQLLPTLPFHITMNALVSVFVTVMKACTFLVLTQGLGQLKWKFFQKKRILEHFVTYDSASRGPWGCVELLAALNRHGWIAPIGALATILAMVIDPFTQQLVQYNSCPTPAANGSIASIPRSSFYDEGSSSLSGRATTGQTGALLGAFYNPELVKTPFACTSGTCTFNQTYAALEYCVRCDDVTSELKVTRQNYTYLNHNYTNVDITALTTGGKLWASPSNYYLPMFQMHVVYNTSDPASINLEMVLAAPATTAKTLETDKARYPNLFSTSTCDTAWQNQTWGCMGKGGAARCVFKPCVRTYSADVSGGILAERLVQTYDRWFTGRQTPTGTFDQLVMADLDCVSNSTKGLLRDMGFNVTNSRFMPYNISVSSITNDYVQLWPRSVDVGTRDLPNPVTNLIPKQCIYVMQETSLKSIQLSLKSFFTSNVTSSTDNINSERAWRVLNDTYVTFHDLNLTFQAIAKSLSVRMRQWPLNGTGEYSKPVIGTTNTEETCVQVRWEWLIYPAFIAVLTVVFFIAVLVVSAAAGSGEYTRDWKNSPLPLIFHGIDGVANPMVDGDEKQFDIRDMDKAAKLSTGYIAHNATPEAPILLRNRLSSSGVSPELNRTFRSSELQQPTTLSPDMNNKPPRYSGLRQISTSPSNSDLCDCEER